MIIIPALLLFAVGFPFFAMEKIRTAPSDSIPQGCAPWVVFGPSAVIVAGLFVWSLPR